MSKQTTIRVATRAFVAEINGERISIQEGERVVDGHEIVAAYPQHFRSRGVEEELAIRSARVAEINDTTRVTNFEPLSESGRRERDEARFWSQVDRMFTRDDRSPEERSEQAFYDRAIAQLEESDSRELAAVNADAERAFGFDRGGWSRRTAD